MGKLGWFMSRTQTTTSLQSEGGPEGARGRVTLNCLICMLQVQGIWFGFWWWGFASCSAVRVCTCRGTTLKVQAAEDACLICLEDSDLNVFVFFPQWRPPDSSFWSYFVLDTFFFFFFLKSHSWRMWLALVWSVLVSWWFSWSSHNRHSVCSVNIYHALSVCFHATGD